jgi:hypothetical protein
MDIDTGLAVVIVAVLVFYLRLIMLQRERIKRVSQSAAVSSTGKGKRKAPDRAAPAPQYSVLSQNPRDLVIAGVGVLLVLMGVLLYMKILPLSVAQTYWWVPTAAGIVAFSWGFKL